MTSGIDDVTKTLDSRYCSPTNLKLPRLVFSAVIGQGVLANLDPELWMTSGIDDSFCCQ